MLISFIPNSVQIQVFQKYCREYHCLKGEANIRKKIIKI